VKKILNNIKRKFIMADNKPNTVNDTVEVASAPPAAAPAPAPAAAPVTQLPPIVDLANRASRSTIAVIDTVVQRGGFRGEELSTIGQLRDQCVQIVALAETEMQNLAQE
jgi:3-oxoacyl-ACP reductase-like protein